MWLHGQAAGGLAPNWSYAAMVGQANLAVPVSWATPLSSVPGDPMISSNDLMVDDATGTLHLLGRARSGAAAYYTRSPAQGTGWEGPHLTLPGAFRARFVVSETRLALVAGPAEGDLVARVVPRAGDLIAALVAAEDTPIALPEGFGDVLAIYPAAGPGPSLSFAVVGRGRENAAWHVELR
jgi:hypothetical protein